MTRNMYDQGGNLSITEGVRYADSRVDDAFSTIIQWLHWRIPFTRGEPRPKEKLYLPNITAEGKAVFNYPDWAYHPSDMMGKQFQWISQK